MKKDRNCGAFPYPIYPMPIGPINPNMYQGVYNQPAGNYTGNLEQQVNNLTNQLSNLERRVTALESLVGNNPQNYNTSNFQML